MKPFYTPRLGHIERRGRAGKHKALIAVVAKYPFYHEMSVENMLTPSLKNTTQSPIEPLHPD